MSRAVHVERRGSLSLPVPPAAAMPLFTPLGEECWVPDWRPAYLHPVDGTTTEGMVFVTRSPDDPGPTLWSLLDWRPERGYARYVRVTPGSRFGEVRVRCSAWGAGTSVAVAYVYTSLDEHGERYLRELTEANFAAMMQDWRSLLEAWLSRPSSAGGLPAGAAGEPGPPPEADRALAEAVREACVRAALDGYQRAQMSGLCGEGAWEAAISAIRMVPAETLLRPDGD